MDILHEEPVYQDDINICKCEATEIKHIEKPDAGIS